MARLAPGEDLLVREDVDCAQRLAYSSCSSPRFHILRSSSISSSRFQRRDRQSSQHFSREFWRMRPAREAHWDAEVVCSAQDGGHARVKGVVLAVAVDHVGAAVGGGGGFAGG